MYRSPDRTAAPSLLARVLAMGAIVVAGLCGGLIGYAVIDLLYDSAVLAGIVGVAGAGAAAAGVAVVVVLAMRAMAEWHSASRGQR